MKRIEFPDPADWPAILERPTARMEDIEESAKEVFRQVRAEGDEAVKPVSYTHLRAHET